MTKPLILVCHWLPDGEMARWSKEFAGCNFVDARNPDTLQRLLPDAEIVYGLPELGHLPRASKLRWIQLASAGVPAALCGPACAQKLRVTNLAGLYGPTIAEHALALLLIVNRNMHIVQGNQALKKWDRSVAGTMRDLHGRTLGIVGLGNIGQNIARLAKGVGMRVVGCRRTPRPTAFVDQVVGPKEMLAMLGEADHLAVAAPLTRETDGMLGAAEFAAVRPGGVYVNVSRGPVAQEAALIEALRSGHVAGAGLDVFTTEPLPPDNPLWTLPNVVVSPHYSGETVNTGPLPAQRFARNLRGWLAGLDLEGNVNLDLGY